MGLWSVIAKSSRQTMGWGRRLGRLARGGEIIGLIGELGAGKTCFVRGVAQGAGVPKSAWVRSPTFTLINEYQGRLPVYHIDLYRVGNHADIEGLNLREYLYADGMSLVEWFEYLPAAEVDEYLELKLAHAGTTARELSFLAHGERYEQLLEGLKKMASPRSGSEEAKIRTAGKKRG
jgi:tRNA threonylcarbamoyladenosine biosynthesis protein TsaE